MTVILRGVDRAAFAAALADRLRAGGVGVSMPGTRAFAAALGVSPPVTKSALYWTARVTLVHRQSDLPAFDAAFAAVFDDAVLPADPHARRTANGGSRPDDAYVGLRGGSQVTEQGAGLPWVTRPAVTGVSAGAPGDHAVPELLPSRLEGLADTPFDELDPASLSAVGEWLAAAARDWPRRRTRRHVAHPAGGRVALRQTMATARRTAWEPLRLVKTRPARRPRRLVMLCDVSQSMQAFVTAYLHLMRAAALTRDSEVFAFSTSLTRLTPALRHKSSEVALREASERVTDRFGGTRIATSVRSLLRSPKGNAVRGAIVVIASDGWDSDPPEELGAAMARLHRRAHRVIWVNPRSAAVGFEPKVGAMAAAMVSCDYFLAADRLGAMPELVDAITSS
jgi:uncharacterized protein with von Willebrand factor type A (vWA) domain